MTRDYAKKPTKVRAPKTIQKKNPTKIDRLGFLIVGIFFGILISPLLELSELVNQNEVKNSNEVLAPVAYNEKIPENMYCKLKNDIVSPAELVNIRLNCNSAEEYLNNLINRLG